MNKKISVTVSDEMYARVVKCADYMGEISIQAVIKQAITEFIRRKKIDNETA